MMESVRRADGVLHVAPTQTPVGQQRPAEAGLLLSLPSYHKAGAGRTCHILGP